jgi:hypothetical protein
MENWQSLQLTELHFIKVTKSFPIYGYDLPLLGNLGDTPSYMNLGHPMLSFLRGLFCAMLTNEVPSRVDQGYSILVVMSSA